ncbi:hypothetical protein B0T26DRAFT_656138 [Lasiosphaeria miniovina]|uniref:Uncharacterized protein n=1 Tax=Lasiosphaeria miniovina TaxID=1954250 RepID=A0AA39ZYF9_9PEZI|nr:uncharacterized protein B0T26DRAFT_656138 [Lasiosphaeria miniovina]KAK0705946.1 hypothetical protein B0T26DRAFT_656138 [Lasiosphaeria miniovina]
MSSQPVPRKPKAACRFAARGHCAKGSACAFAHPGPSSLASPPTPTSGSPEAKAPCRYFAAGHCARGDACHFAHQLAPSPAPGSVVVSVQSTDQHRDTWIRELGGGFAEFEDGAVVAKVSLPSDIAGVRLDRLPPHSTPQTVTALLTDMDVAGDVRVTATDSRADVHVDDPVLAKAMYSRLKLRTGSSQIAFTPIPSPMPRGSGLHRVDCRRVHCSWHRPIRTAWLNFGSEKVAQKAQQKFDVGIYRVAGTKVKAKAPTVSKDPSNRRVWTVMLEMPGTADKLDIMTSIPDFARPRHIELGLPSYTADADTAATIVKSMLLQAGPLEWWELGSSGGKRVKAQARFVEESHAREAALTLNNKLLSFSRTARLTIQLMTSSKVKVLARVYDAVGEQLESQRAVWERQFVRFLAYPPQHGYRVLKLEAEDPVLVARAKDSLDRVIAGVVASSDGSEIWSASFQRNGDAGCKGLKRIEEEHGIAIVRDRRKSQLRLFGSEERCSRAVVALEQLVKDESGGDNQHVVELDADQFEWACRGGFRTIGARLGDDMVTFDIVSTPKRILVAGSEQDHAFAVALIARREASSVMSASDTTKTNCSVCWNDAEQPVRTSCGHVYCVDCFVALCHAQSSPTDFCITCVGNSAQCKQVLALAELQELLPSATFEDLLEASFAFFISRHPARFRYCPTPDCGQIYRASPSSPDAAATQNTFTCAKCLVCVCTACHGLHPGMTCAEHRDDTSGARAAVARVKQALGIKDCPRCRTAMEKIDGCNHVTCGGCATHICWVCLATFDMGDECYGHMNKEHGGVFDV